MSNKRMIAIMLISIFVIGITITASANGYKGNIVSYDPTITITDPQKLVEILDKVPENVVNTFLCDSWEFKLSDENLANKYGYSKSVIGITDFRNKEIVISNTQQGYMDATVHEFGHYVDYKCGYINKSKAFQDLYLKDYDTIAGAGYFDEYQPNSTQEYFAEVYALCIMYPEEMMELVPDTFTFMTFCNFRLEDYRLWTIG